MESPSGLLKIMYYKIGIIFIFLITSILISRKERNMFRYWTAGLAGKDLVVPKENRICSGFCCETVVLISWLITSMCFYASDYESPLWIYVEGWVLGRRKRNTFLYSLKINSLSILLGHLMSSPLSHILRQSVEGYRSL